MQDCQTHKKQLPQNLNMCQLSVPKQTKAYLERLCELAEEKGSYMYQYSELVLEAKKMGNI
jgi:hypothetical protein